MPAFIDLTGKKYGRLTVIKRSLKNIRNRPAWDCVCECGQKVSRASHDLKNGDTKSCGCLRKDLLRIDLKGKRFGKLTVFGKGESRGKSTSEFWLCKCDCGNDHIVSSQHLQNRQIKSCGCLKEEFIKYKKYEKNFFSQVNKTNYCWNWMGSKDKGGYGIFFADKMIKSHRYSFILHNGKIENKKIVCHKCDNRLCVNPEHLYAGTYKQNSEDMCKRNRQRKPKGFKRGTY